jgi:signal transduction histidine kinase/putative methionine-R-sulfoxide reductase with GAF domain
MNLNSFIDRAPVAQILPSSATMLAMPEDLDRLRKAYEERVRDLQASVVQRQRELATLAEIASRVHGADGEQEVLDIALEEILGQLGLDAAWIFVGDPHDKKLRLAAWRGVSQSYLEDIHRDGLGECLCPEVFWSGHRMQARNTLHCPRMPGIVDGLQAPVAHACIPLKFEGRTKGVLNVAARPGETFTEDELRFLETVGHQVGLAVERARHRVAEDRRDQEARAMAAIARAIGGALDVASVLRAVGSTGREVLGADRALILLGSSPEAMRVGHVSGVPHPELAEGQTVDLVTAGARLLIAVLADRTPCVIDDWSRDARTDHALARRWQSLSGIVAPLAAGERVLGLLVLTRVAPSRWRPEQLDVAAALAAQASVALENARLYEEARGAYRELKEAQDRIIQQERMAVLGTFSSGLAHEVRNPLNSISLQLSILERRISRLEGKLAGEMGSVAGIIRDEVRRLDGLVGDFLLFSRAGRVQHEPGDLDEVVDEVVRLLTPEAEGQGVSVRREKQAAQPPVRMDAEKMKQVVINLLRNALEAMPGGGVVSVESGLHEGGARIVVRDTGPGLPPEIDVFQIFVTTKPQGTGLGLSIVQQIVQQHRGEVRAANDPAGGACFTVTVPLDGGQEGEGR